MNWTVAVESHVDSSFFWGYLITQIPGGFIASKFPANKIFGLSIVSSATLHLIVPFAMTLMHGHVVICVRVLQGLFEVCNQNSILPQIKAGDYGCVMLRKKGRVTRRVGV